MIAREKVIKGFECCKYENKLHCNQCPYDYNGRGNERYECTAELSADALALLKEQEAVEPILKREGRNKYYNYYVCRCCDNDLFYQQNYCSECGRAVKWDV